MKLKSTRFIPVSSTDLSGAVAYDDQRIGLKDYGSFSDTAYYAFAAMRSGSVKAYWAR